MRRQGFRHPQASKVAAGHLARAAYLYVRQSTLRAVLTNTESACGVPRTLSHAVTWSLGRVS